MPSISLRPFRFGLFVPVVAAAVLSGCGNPLALPPAQFENRVDTVTLYALRETAIGTPSGFDVVGRRASRTDLAQPFDFAFDIDSTGAAVLLPAASLGVSGNAGMALQDTTFEGLTEVPTVEFTTDRAVAIAAGNVLVIRSRPSSDFCSLLGSLPRYGKLRVLGLDPTARTMTFEAVINVNCGYRNLEPGFPES